MINPTTGLRILLAMVLAWHAALAGAVSWVQTDLQVLPALDAGSVDADYHFTNTGDQALAITVTTSCNCTVASSDKTSYAPGAHGCVHATMHFGDRSGPQLKDITVSFSDGEKQMLLLRSVAPPVFAISERFLHWRCGGPLETRQVRIDVAEPYRIHVLTPKPARTVTMEIRELDPGRSFLVLVTPRSTTQPDLDYLHIETDHPVHERSAITLYVDMTPEPEPRAAPVSAHGSTATPPAVGH